VCDYSANPDGSRQVPHCCFQSVFSGVREKNHQTGCRAPEILNTCNKERGPRESDLPPCACTEKYMPCLRAASAALYEDLIQSTSQRCVDLEPLSRSLHLMVYGTGCPGFCEAHSARATSSCRDNYVPHKNKPHERSLGKRLPMRLLT
jgi:hypothetical protein